ncbi:hypothetical protein DFH09DRAFT_1310268 [Mycena vulgaris]|nr:hypothetical protein DFH09DRAFT_1310268 [Mycena vulgaris]
MEEARTECLSCRITGTATFTGLGIYALWMSRATAPGSPGSKKFVAAFGVALLVGGVRHGKLPIIESIVSYLLFYSRAAFGSTSQLLAPAALP